MFQTLFMGLLLSYLSFDVPQGEKVWQFTREDQGRGLYANAFSCHCEEEECELTVFIDDGCNCKEDVLLDQAFAKVYFGLQVIGEDDEGNLVIAPAIDGDGLPDFILEQPDGAISYLVPIE